MTTSASSRYPEPSAALKPVGLAVANEPTRARSRFGTVPAELRVFEQLAHPLDGGRTGYLGLEREPFVDQQMIVVVLVVEALPGFLALAARRARSAPSSAPILSVMLRALLKCAEGQVGAGCAGSPRRAAPAPRGGAIACRRFRGSGR